MCFLRIGITLVREWVLCGSRLEWAGEVGGVRVGYGLFYGRLPGATVRSALVNTATGSL